jgi:hypothetical protein
MKIRKIILGLSIFIIYLQPLLFAQTTYNIVIDSIVARINTAPLRQFVRELSGDTTCIIGGNYFPFVGVVTNKK